jgi:hypothetical protein
VGATLDLAAGDPVSRAVTRALIADAGPADALPAVGIASVVNDTASGIDALYFTATLEDGRAVVLQSAADALRTARGPAARAARAAVARVPARIPSRGAGVAYVVLRGAPADQVASVAMVAGPAPAITLPARRR